MEISRYKLCKSNECTANQFAAKWQTFGIKVHVSKNLHWRKQNTKYYKCILRSANDKLLMGKNQKLRNNLCKTVRDDISFDLQQAIKTEQIYQVNI